MEILNGDCLLEMSKMADKSVDLFICDLPYIGLSGKSETNCSWNKTEIDLNKFWKEFKRIRKSKRTACIHFCSTKFGYSLIKSWEKGFKMDMVYDKRNCTGGMSSKYRPMKSHEMIYFFYEQAPKYNRDKYHTKINSIAHSKSETTNEKSTDKDNIVVLERKKSNFEPVQPRSVFKSEKVFIGKRHHQTEKPQDILEFFLKYWSDEDDVILDPTMGSGSTGVACQKLNRKFIGIELNESIFETAKKRLEL